MNHGHISKKDNLGKILSREEFNGFSQFILPLPGGLLAPLLKLMNLSVVGLLAKTWNIEDMADGLNRIIDLANSGSRVHYDIWSEAEKAVEPRKNETALFHFPAKGSGHFVLVCAGGGYMGVASIIEGFPVAAELNKMGYSAFVLHYRTGKKNPWPAPMEDLQKALHFILDQTNEFNLEKENYAVVGFSAGGHLSASLGTDNYGAQTWKLPKPGTLILGYPATMFENMTEIHRKCRDIMIGENCTQEQIDSINIVLHATPDYPATYIWQCSDDDAVYLENSEMLAKRLKELGVRCKYKVVLAGGHGIGLGSGTQAQGWLAEAIQFWQSAEEG